MPGQPYLLSARESGVQSQIQANRYVGIGIQLALDDKETRLPVILRVVPDGPADRAGINAGDLIERIDQATVKPGTRSVDVVQQLHSAKGTTLMLRIRSKDTKTSRSVSLLRTPVMIRSVREFSKEKIGTERKPRRIPRRTSVISRSSASAGARFTS